MQHDAILTDRQDDILMITLNRPAKKNAMNTDMMHALIKTASDIKKDKTLRAVIITGGADFCSGLDLSLLNSPKSMAWAMVELAKPTPSIFQKVCLIWQELPVPVLAVIDGVCLGAGLQLALGADIRISTPDARFAVLEAKWGLVADMGLSHTAKGVRADHLQEFAMSAKLFDAKAAHAAHVVSHINDNPMAYAMTLAKEFAQRSPDAVLAAKRLTQGMASSSYAKLYQEKLWQIKLILGANRKLAIKKAKDGSVKFLKRQFG